MYLSKALVVIYVVDSTDKARFPLAKEHLHKLLSTNPLLPLMVLANKQVSEFTVHVVLDCPLDKKTFLLQFATLAFAI